MTEPNTPPVYGCTIDGQPAMPILVSEHTELVARAEQAEAARDRYARLADDRAEQRLRLTADRDGLRTRLAEQEAETMRQHEHAQRAEAELRRHTEAESADAAAGSYAGRAEQAEADLAEARQDAANAYGQRDRLRNRIIALADRWRLPGHISMPDAAAEIAEALDREKWAPTPDPIARVRALADRWKRNGTRDLARYADIMLAELDDPKPTTPADAEPDACQSVEVDGETIRVRGAGQFTEREQQFAAEIVRAAKRKYAAETGPEEPPQPTEAEQLAERVAALQTIVNRVREAVAVDEAAPTRATPDAEPDTVTDPAWLCQQYAKAIAADDGHPWDTLPADRQWAYLDNADAVMRVRDRHVEQLRQRLTVADQTRRDDLTETERLRARLGAALACVKLLKIYANQLDHGRQVGGSDVACRIRHILTGLDDRPEAEPEPVSGRSETPAARDGLGQHIVNATLTALQRHDHWLPASVTHAVAGEVLAVLVAESPWLKATAEDVTAAERRAEQLAALAHDILYADHMSGDRIAGWRERLDTITDKEQP